MLPPPKPSYKPTFHMPVIGPPPPGTDPATYYGAVTGATTLQVESVANQGLKTALSNPTYSQLFAMTGGVIKFIPMGNPLPTAGAEPSPGAGSVVLKTWVVDVTQLKKVLPPGVPPMTSILYLNVKPGTVRASLDPLVRALPEAALRLVWIGPSEPANRAEMEDHYLNSVLMGQAELFVPGGTPLGEAGPRDPTNPAAGTEFILRFTDGAGNDLSPLLHLRGMPGYGGVQWTAHPLVSALSGIPVPVDIYLQFEVWDETLKVFEPLPAGIAIALMEADPVIDDILATQNTDAQGRVHFSFPDLQATTGETPDIFFQAQCNGLNHAGHTLPNEWSTKGWRAADGSPGYYPSFTGTQLGSAVSPLVFRIGLDFHARLEYRNARTGANDPAPKGILVEVRNGITSPTAKTLRTDDNGEINCVTFDIPAGADVFLCVWFEIEDSAINMMRTTADPVDEAWVTSGTDADKKDYPNNETTSIGTQSNPEIFRCTINDRNVCLYFLKVFRELSTFLFHLTVGAWTGVQNLNLIRGSITGIAFSWPVGKVNIPASDYWDRGTLIHEMSHQIMWKEVNFSSLGIAYEAILGDLDLYHVTNLLANPEHALIEGWAEFIEAVFAGTTPVPYPVTTLVDRVSGQPTYPLGPPPNNRGESVEGAFADGLLAIFQNHVVTSNVATNAHIPESRNGNVIVTAPWIQDSAVQQRFLAMIWEPLKYLKSLSNPTTTDMFDYIKTTNWTVWHNLQPDLGTFNIAMAVPTVASVSPPSGPRAGGQQIIITGTDFVLGTQVRIGGTAATNIHVTNSTTLTADTPPGMPGPADIFVITPSGSDKVSGGYVYQ